MADTWGLLSVEGLWTQSFIGQGGPFLLFTYFTAIVLCPPITPDYANNPLKMEVAASYPTVALRFVQGGGK
jgi:hypothetical protein